MTEVHLIYTGIVGFVRTDGGLTVVIQDARSAGHHEPHVPHVVVEEGAYVSSANLTSLGTHNRLRGFLLEHYEVAVGNAIGERRLKEDANFGEFVLVLERGCPPSSRGCGGILRHVLGGPVPSTVAARMPLSNGTLETTFVDPYDLWQFDGLAVEPMRLAEEVCHNFHIEANVLVLSFYKNSTPSGELRVKVPPKARTIEVRIGNLPARHIFDPPLDPRTDDEHVKLYYDLSALPPSSRRKLRYSKAATKLPNPPQEGHHTHRLTPAEQQGPLVRGPNCPPALWA